MDHKLIDQALNTLLSTKAIDRTAEQVQGFAHLVCSAAGVAIDLPTPTLAGLPELHAAVSLLATELDINSLNPATSVQTEIRITNSRKPLFSVYLHNPHGFGGNTKILSGYGASSEEVLRSLRDNAHDLCKPEVE